MDIMKKCTKCGIDNPLTNFYIDGRKLDGVSSICKECQKELQVIYHRGDKFKKYQRSYERNKYKNNESRRKQLLVRASIRWALNGKVQNPITAEKYLGTKISDYKNYLESMFKYGMSWSNYGKGGWVIDHIKPLCLFDFNNEEDVLKAFHYTNTQPLWWAENSKKWKRY